MKRATQMIEVSRRALTDPSGAPFFHAPPPPDPWFVRGPRGGLYLATGKVTRSVSHTINDAFIRDMVVVIDRSEGVRYLRPGSRLRPTWPPRMVDRLDSETA